MPTKASARTTRETTGTHQPSEPVISFIVPGRVSTLDLNICPRRLTRCLIGGYLDEHGTQPETIVEQIDQAYVNVDIALKDAGGAGWSQVYRVNSFHVQLDPVSQEAMVRNFKKWMPDNHPTWTCVQVGRLGGDNMWVEIEVSAFDHEGAKREGTSKA